MTETVRGKWRDLDPQDGGLDPWKVPQAPLKPHRLLREVYRHYTEFKELFKSTGIHTLTHTYEWFGPDLDEESDAKGHHPADLSVPHKETVSFSLWDLERGINKLPERKRQAFYLNVICDLLQKEAGAIMGINHVTVGQYVEQCMIFLAKEQLIKTTSIEEQEDGDPADRS